MEDADTVRGPDLEAEVERWLPKIRRLLYRLQGFRGEVDDLAQDVFLRWWQGRSRIRDLKHEHSFLCGIAVRVHREALRRKTPSFEDMDLAGQSDDPVNTNIAGELRSAAEYALRALPDTLRDVLVLSVYEGLSPAEIAQALELSSEAVRNRLFRARAAMKNALAPHLEERER